MTVKSGSSSATLTLGKTENAVVFAKDAARPLIFTVAPTLRDDVIKPVGDFRRKDVFDFRSFTATRVEFTRGTATQTFEKSKSKDKDGKDVDVWKDAKGATVETMKIEDLLTKVSGLRASSFEATAPAALKTPVVTVKAQLRLEDGNGDHWPFRRRRVCRAAGRARRGQARHGRRGRGPESARRAEVTRRWR